MPALDQVLARIDQNRDAALNRLFGLLRIPSVSTDPAYKADCRRAAEWFVAELKGLGFEASVRDTTGHPMVVAHRRKPGAKRVLFYGHYDVQPVDPVTLWAKPPFEPYLAPGPDGRTFITARGACDDKGQVMTFVEAARGFIETVGELPLNVTIFLEGEEECGSPSLGPFLDTTKDELKADIALVCDTGMWDGETPAITTMLRGIAHEEVTIHAADRDLHSGMYGGAAANPLRILSKIIGAIHDEDGRITIPHFYEGVPELPHELRQMWQKLDVTTESFLGTVGLKYSSGEVGRGILEQVWARPTAEVNGMHGGYTGEGTKTVIASQASAKFTFRLVFDQDPEAIVRNFRAFVEARVPKDCRVEFGNGSGSPALVLATTNPALARARDALSTEWGTPAVMIGSGGSIPVVGSFKRVLGMDALMVGFGLKDDRIHSPNEKYDLKSFQKGARSWARIMTALAA